MGLVNTPSIIRSDSVTSEANKLRRMVQVLALRNFSGDEVSDSRAQLLLTRIAPQGRSIRPDGGPYELSRICAKREWLVACAERRGAVATLTELVERF